MLSEPPHEPLDLLVIGGLTIDRFADGSAAPGGSVIHIARAAAPRDVRVGMVTAAGPEAETQAGLAELRRLAAWVDVRAGPLTTIYRHRESLEGRRLWLEQRGGPVATPSPLPSTRVVLCAPVADEVPTPLVRAAEGLARRGAILQGWLRSTESDTEVRPMPLATLDAALVEALSHQDLLVASREDLRAEGSDPAAQLRAMRRDFGPRPSLVVSDGAGGVWIDGEGGSRHLGVPRRVAARSAVGAGDILTAFMLYAMADGSLTVIQAAESAMQVVVEVLEQRSAG